MEWHPANGRRGKGLTKGSSNVGKLGQEQASLQEAVGTDTQCCGTWWDDTASTAFF